MLKWLSKALTTLRHPPRPMFNGRYLARTRFDYRKAIGDGLDSSVVTAPIQWIQRSLPEARLTVRRTARDGTIVELADHQALQLIRRPNPYYGDIALWAGTVLSWCLDGNAYWLKVRNGVGRPVELWYVPHWTMEAKGSEDGSVFLSHYLYSPGGGIPPMRIDPDDVVHFRHGIDPRNPRRGISPIDGVIREIFMDLESSNFVAALLKNMGVPGVVISPKAGGVVPSDDVEATKLWFTEQFGGDRRGGPLVMGAPTDVQPYGFNPQQMNMSEARDVAEERICASLGIPAAVVGFGAGLQSTKVGATMTELRKLAWHNGVLPIGRGFADEIDRSLLPDFGEAESLQSWWDTTEVIALVDDEDKRVKRILDQSGAGIIQVYEAREELGWVVDDSHRIYLRPAMQIEVPATKAGEQSDTTVSDEPAIAATTAAEVPAETALNGAQIAALRDITQAVAAGEIPSETAVQLIVVGFPAIGEERARRIVAPLTGFTPPEPKEPKSLKAKARASTRARQAGRAYILALQRQEGPLQKAMERRVNTFFKALGKAAHDAARPLLDEVAPKAAAPGETKANERLVEQILKALGIPAHRTAFERLYEAHYLDVAKKVAEAAELAGISGSLPDPVARSIAGAGGRRAGLVDLTAQSKTALFDAIAEGLSEGEGAQQLANRIARHVEAGPWAAPEIRARTIARTETKYAQNVSTIERARAANVERFIVFDGRLGPGRSRDDHIARDGSIVSAAEAAQMAADEHPNGTLSFAPHFGEDD